MVFPSNKNVTRDVDGNIGVPMPTLSPHAVPLGYLDEQLAPFSAKRPMPQGTDLNTLKTSGYWLVQTTATANTMANLPVGPIPAFSPNLALNSKQINNQVITTTTSSTTYWTVGAVTVGVPSASPKGTTTVATVASTGSPRGNGMLASVYNLDGLSNTGPARTITVSFTTTTANPCEYRLQAGGAWTAMAVGAGAWNTVTWDVAASTHVTLEVRRVGGVTPSTELVWITDVISTPGPGTIRAGQAGLLKVTETETRVIQEYYQVVNLGTVPTYRWALFRRMCSASGTWAPWFLQEGTIPVYGEAQQNTAANVLNASTDSQVWTMRVDSRGVGTYGTRNGNTWWQSTGGGVSAPGWTNVSFVNGWTNYSAAGGTYLGGQYKRTVSGIVMLRGLVASGYAGQTIFTLPVGYRPAQQLVFIALVGGGLGHIVVYPDGRVVLTGVNFYGVNPVGFASLAQIMFPCAEVAPNEAWTPIPMVNSFYSYEQGWPTASYWVDEIGRYWLRGLAGRATSPGGVETVYGQLPAAAATNQQIHLATPGNNGFSSQHYVNANLVWKPGGSNGYAWTGVPTAPIIPKAIAPEVQWANFIPMLNGWVNYDPNTFPMASLWEAPDGISHVRGLIRSGSGTIHNLSSSYGPTPLGQSIYITDATEAAGRADMAYSNIGYNLGSNTWFSLDGIYYLRES